MKNILVTGGAGFIGSNFIRYLMEVEPEANIVNLDALTYAGSPENIKDLSSIFVHGNICDARLVKVLLRKHKIDTIVNFAAESHVDRSIANPVPFIQTNIIGTYVLLEQAKDYWANDKNVRFLHISTDEVFGSLAPDDPPSTEKTPYAPNSPYSATKAASDHLVRAYVNTYGLPCLITNCSNNYGPYQFPEKLIPRMFVRAMDGKSLTVHGDGQQIRDWLHVIDHCEAVFMVLENGRIGETYNIGYGNQFTNLEIIEKICDTLDELVPANNSRRKLIQFVDDRPGNDRRYDLSTDKIFYELGWEPRYNLSYGLLHTLQWYLDNPEWVKAICKQLDER